MKELSNYIIEKLDINKVKLYDKFPIDGSFEDIDTFLKANNFKYTNFWSNNVFDAINKESDKVFYGQKETDDCFRFLIADTSKAKISDSNPLFIIRHKYGDDEICYFYGDNLYTRYSKKDFLKALNKKFHWK